MRSQHFHLLKGSEIEFDGHHRTREYKFNKKVMFYFLKNYNLIMNGNRRNDQVSGEPLVL
jgi:hypothetical protein